MHVGMYVANLNRLVFLMLSIQPKIINNDKLLYTPNVRPIYYEIYLTIQLNYAYQNKQYNIGIC